MKTMDETLSEVLRKEQRGVRDVARLEDEGHTPHCARRIVWGDGGCECAMLPEVAADTICTELGAIISKLPKRGE